MKKLFVALAAFSVFESCTDSSDKRASADSIEGSTMASGATVTEIQPLRPDIELIPWEGDLLDAIYWKDSIGENAFVVSGLGNYVWETQKPDLKTKLRSDQDPKKYSNATEIYGRHYVLKFGEDKWKLHYEYYNYLISPFVVMMQYQKNSLIVSDLDSNGVGEALFLYTEAGGENLEKHYYSGKMIFFHDSIANVSVGPIGLGVINSPPPETREGSVHLACPDTPGFSVFLLNQWSMYFKEQEKIDRESITEKSKLDEHGHESYDH